MQIFKWQTPEGHVIIKSNTYRHTFEYIQELVAIAKVDFPELQDSDIDIKVYNDNRWGKQTGIEFQAPIQEGYETLHQLPHTYN